MSFNYSEKGEKVEEKLREEFKTYNFDLNDHSWKEKLPSVTVEKSERIGNRPKISVIIANYNNSPYLERMMNSLVNQSIGIENLQILFVDDRSTDDSVDKVQTFMKKYPNIELYVLDENTGGAHGPRNVGLLYAKGEYLVILDADDWYDQRGLEIFYHSLEKSGDDLVFGGVVRSKNGQLELMTRAYNAQKSESLPISELPYDFYNWLGPQGNMIRHSLIKEHNLHFIDQRVADDVNFFYQALLFSKKISQVQEITTYVNRDDDNLSLSRNINENFLISWLRTLSYLIETYNDVEDIQRFITRRLEWILVDFTLRWDTNFGLNVNSIQKLRRLIELYLSDLGFDPNLYFSLDVYRYIWEYLKTKNDEKLLRFVGWHTLPSIDKSLKKVGNLYYFISEEKDLPWINKPLVNGREIITDETGIYLRFDYYVPESINYVELRNDDNLNHVFRKKVIHLSGVTYELQITPEEFNGLSAGIHRLYIILKSQIEHLVAIDKLQVYCTDGALLSEKFGVVNLYKPVSDHQFVLAFKALPEKYLGQFIQIQSVLNNEGSYEYSLPDGEIISQENYQNSIIPFPEDFKISMKEYAIKAGVYKLKKAMLFYSDKNERQQFLSTGYLITVTHIWFTDEREMILTTSAGQLVFDKEALIHVEEPVEITTLKNIYSYIKPIFDKQNKKKHYLKGTRIIVKSLVFNEDFRVRFLTNDGTYITENPEFVAFSENVSDKKIKKMTILQAIRQRRGSHEKNI